MAVEVNDGIVHYLIEHGVIFEINRQALHPRGMRLVAETGTNRLRILLTEDSAGFVYADEDMPGSSLRKDLFDDMLLPDRISLFGDYRQPTDWVEPDESGS